MAILRPLITAVILGWAAASSSALAEEYRIKLFRPHDVGEQYRMVMLDSFQSNSTMYRGGMVLETGAEHRSAKLDTWVYVTEISNSGEATENFLTTISYTRTIDGQESEILPPKSSILTNAPRTRYVILDEELTEEIESELHNAFLFFTEPEEFAPFESQKPRAVGETWQLSKEQAFEDYFTLAGGKPEADFDKEDMVAKCTLKGIVERYGMPCLHVEAEFTAPTASVHEIRESIVSNKMSRTIRVVFLAPVDEEKPLLARAFQVESNYVFTAANGVTAEVMNKTTTKISYRDHHFPKQKPVKD